MRAVFAGVLIFVFGMGVTSLVALRDHFSRVEIKRQEMSALADQRSADLARRLGSYETFARLAASTFIPHDPLSTNALDDFARRTLKLIPDAYSVVWGAWVEPQHRPTAEEKLKLADLKIFGPHFDKTPPVDMALFVNFDVEPSTQANRRSVGLALNTRAEPRAAIEQAVRTGGVSATAPTYLVQNPSTAAVIVYGPAYSADGSLVGVIGFSFEIATLLRPVFRDDAVRVFDAGAADFGPVYLTNVVDKASTTAVRAVQFAGRTYRMEFLSAGAAGSYVHILPIALTGLLISSLLGGLAWLTLFHQNSIAIALAKKSASESHLVNVVRELNHRIRNTCTIAVSLARLSFREAGMRPTLDEFCGRLTAIATGASRAEATELAALISELIRPFGDIIESEGPPVLLLEPSCEYVPLALHELITNSIKYGAIKKGGSIRISWKCDDKGVDLEWDERSVTVVQIDPGTGFANFSSGFGSRLLREIIPIQIGGRSELVTAPSMVRYELFIPFSQTKQLVLEGAAA